MNNHSKNVEGYVSDKQTNNGDVGTAYLSASRLCKHKNELIRTGIF